MQIQVRFMGENATVGEVAWRIGIMYHIRIEGLAHTI
jgi:hypothetical protein